MVEVGWRVVLVFQVCVRMEGILISVGGGEAMIGAVTVLPMPFTTVWLTPIQLLEMSLWWKLKGVWGLRGSVFKSVLALGRQLRQYPRLAAARASVYVPNSTSAAATRLYMVIGYQLIHPGGEPSAVLHYRGLYRRPPRPLLSTQKRCPRK
jgi:hypothetical protein